VKRGGKRFSAVGLAFVLTVLAEVLAFIAVWHFIGFGWTFLLLVGVSVVGAVLVRSEGTRAWQRWRAVAAAGERPGPQLTRALVGLVGAVLVAIPGFVTGLIGLALFLPPVRAIAGRGATGLATRRLAPHLVGDLFGPRRVRVKAGAPVRDAGRFDGSTPIEGEIV
jgi:UPF0716 protein FxsA